MRCRFCGSQSLHEDTQHKNFSAGKAVTGAVVFGVVGTAAGFIGKEKKGYRCGACGQFMDSPMDYFTESQIDSAIRAAEEGRSRTLFDYYHSQYANIQANIPVAVSQTVAAAPVEEVVYRPMIPVGTETSIKRSYRYGLWEPSCPVWVEAVILKNAQDGDRLSLVAWNTAEKPLRSAYFTVNVFDDTGDQVSECQCVYQGMSVPCGEKLPEEKEFSLKTDLAYRVELICEKASFDGDAVWRRETEASAFTLPEQPELSEDNFPRLKYADPLFTGQEEKGAARYRMPVESEGFWMCCCGMPVLKGQKCSRCGDTLEHVMHCFSQPYLLERQQTAVHERAAKRAAVLDDRLRTLKAKQEAQEKAEKDDIYNKACAAINDSEGLKTIGDYEAAIGQFEAIAGWRDAEEKINFCRQKIAEVKEKEEAERAAAARAAEAAKAAAAEKAKKIKKIAGIAAGILAIVGIAAFVYIQFILPGQKKDQAKQYLEAGNYEAAYALLEEIEDTETIRQSKADRAKDLLAAKDYEAAYKLLEEIGDGDTVKQSKASRAQQLLTEKDYETAYTLLREIGDTDTIKQSKADRAKELLTEKDYEAAYTLLQEIGDTDTIKQSKADRAKELLTKKDYDQAYALLQEIGDTESIKQSKYDRAVDLLNAGDYEAAYVLLNGLDYKDSSDKITKCLFLRQKAGISNVSVGSTIKFGYYEQDNDTSNGKEEIEWIVLAVDDHNYALVISKYGLDNQPYDEDYRDKAMTWEECSLRTWLNGTFYNEAFGADHQQMIRTSVVTADTNPQYYNISPGNTTKDKVFLLSVREAEKYFVSNEARNCQGSAYCYEQGAHKERDSCWWWLRTPGYKPNCAALVDNGGSVLRSGTSVSAMFGAVRPAMWIYLGS